MKSNLIRLLDSIPHRVSVKWMAGLVAWVMVVGTIYLYQVEKFGPMTFLGACATAMFFVEFKMVRHKSADAQDEVAKFGRLALACFVVAIAGAVAVFAATTYQPGKADD